MNAVAVTLIAVGTLIVVYLASRTSSASGHNPFTHSREAFLGDHHQSGAAADEGEHGSDPGA